MTADLYELKRILRLEARKKRKHFYTHHKLKHEQFSLKISSKVYQFLSHTQAKQTIMGYYPLHDEADIRSLLEKLHSNPNITLALPRTLPSSPTSKTPSPSNSNNIAPHKNTVNKMIPIALAKEHQLTDQLHPAKYGIMEVRAGKILNPEEIDILIIPGLLFDKNGHRLGYGGGYYDHFIDTILKNNSPNKPSSKPTLKLTSQPTSQPISNPISRPQSKSKLKLIGVCFEFQKHPQSLPHTPHDKPLHHIFTETNVYHYP